MTGTVNGDQVFIDKQYLGRPQHVFYKGSINGPVMEGHYSFRQDMFNPANCFRLENIINA